MRLKRNLADKILKLLELFPVVVLIGVRQSGKTTLARSLKPDWRYMDLETGASCDLISQDAGLFLRQNPRGVIFDEAQLYPRLFSELRHAIDAERGEMGRYIITGSSSPELVKAISESLAGRVATIRVSPLKLNEYTQKPLSPFFEILADPCDVGRFCNLQVRYSHQEVLEHWLFGGYPEPRLRKDPLFNAIWYEEYIKTYVERDISGLFPGLNRTRYRRFVQTLASISATTINQSDLARTLEVSSPTIKEYLDIASGTFLWRSLPSFERNVMKALIKMPRGHLCDSGLRHALQKLQSLEMLQAHPSMGLSFEAFVIEEIIRGLEATLLTNWSPHFYRTRAKSEIDLILDTPNGIIPIEIKYSSSPKSTSLRTLDTFIKEHNCPFGLLVNNSERVEQLGERLYQIPVGAL